MDSIIVKHEVRVWEYSYDKKKSNGTDEFNGVYGAICTDLKTVKDSRFINKPYDEAGIVSELLEVVANLRETYSNMKENSGNFGIRTRRDEKTEKGREVWLRGEYFKGGHRYEMEYVITIKA